jgi:hypothetical protein
MGPPKHGQISVSEMKISHAKKHLASMVQHARTMASYHGTDPNNMTTDYGSSAIWAIHTKGCPPAGSASGRAAKYVFGKRVGGRRWRIDRL